MHRLLKKLLRNTHGIAESAIVVTVDVRGFTEFCQEQESPAVAYYLKHLYLDLVTGYYPNSRFFKPTGDGLMIIRPYGPRTLAKVASSTVLSSLRLVDEFPNICEGDAMVNFPVPTKVGVGICRGPVCAIVSGKRTMATLDYSGRALNLSSRLTEMARPAGVVLDSAFGIDLLRAGISEAFAEESVYVRSIAEREPMGIHYSKEWTTILPIFKTPMVEPRWRKLEYVSTIRALNKRGRFMYPLPSPPADPNTIMVRIVTPKVGKGGGMGSGLRSWHNVKGYWDYVIEAGRHQVEVDFPKAVGGLRRTGVKLTWPAVVHIDYHEQVV